MNLPEVSFDHVLRLSDAIGLFEHAELTVARPEHGYCVDDVARGLIAIMRERSPSGPMRQLAQRYLRFVMDAQTADGYFHNRRGVDGAWQDQANLEDCWGRAVWALGTTVGRSPAHAASALACFDIGVQNRSVHPRAMAFAALGAAEVLRVRPSHTGARSVLADAAALIGRPNDDPNWRWPEARLRYANAALPQVLICAGYLLGDTKTLADGFAMLTWLVEVESFEAHVSVTPVGGWSLGEARPAFDQQPIEVAALADACALAYEVTDDGMWREAVLRCAAWFMGDNDSSIALIDPVSGGGCDGLEADGRNENQGAESTLALISTMQQAHRVLGLQLEKVCA